MILWSIQPIAIYDSIMRNGVYRCDEKKITIMRNCLYQYDWLASQLRKRIGDPPRNVLYPVWAWYMWENRRKKPDLRHERWSNGWSGERFACMEIDVPDEKVVLSDFDAWSLILVDALLSETEEEDEILEREYDALPEDKKQSYKEKNWERLFDLSPLDTDWITRGSSIQANFWELKKEYIRDVRFFTAAHEKPDHKNSRKASLL